MARDVEQDRDKMFASINAAGIVGTLAAYEVDVGGIPAGTGDQHVS